MIPFNKDNQTNINIVTVLNQHRVYAIGKYLLIETPS